MFSSSGAVKESLIREREGQEKLKGGTCAYAGGVCSAATSLNLLCIVEGCLVYTRLHICVSFHVKLLQVLGTHTGTMRIYVHRKEGRSWRKWRRKILQSFQIFRIRVYNVNKSFNVQSIIDKGYFLRVIA